MIDTEVLEQVGHAARDRITDAYRRMSAGEIDRAMMRRVLADATAASVAAAQIDGDAMALRQLAELGIDVAPDFARRRRDRATYIAAAKEAAEHRKRLERAVDTILTESTGAGAERRLGRLALAESINATRDRTAELMKGAREVDGWVRQLDSDPCELCQWWARDDRVWPAGHTMPTHKGCACAQRWTVQASASVRMTSRKGQIASAKRAEAGSLEQRRTMHEGAYSTRAKRGTDGTPGTA